ncbi:glycosyl transferase, group 2 family protein [Coleofasciculus chthonoplastes PCC 7420]|uniref:Glycosyl transferase, group 2 family protein n=1 Tax=Coleofasciculus chthonoplastes PCC 7420 TaxID=118168 RepID=B4W1J9_9CYAN|nr:glycosyltransferase [Coleofasciculus chthonoplastes]EDX71996.1 glycosyl transferase, group 2 family protein [Coleofasciculus chthonoplastes PCC 7420]
MTRIGVVTIGRNEGQRLIRCLKSAIALLPQDTPIIYVDSGSTDGSVAAAESLGVQVINLDMSRPFTMARGRNTGFRYLIEHFPDIKYVQFIDGDCELIPGWIEQAKETLDNDDKLAIACGRRRERFPDASIYNRLADMEWNTPVGEAKACGGDALIRVSAIREVNGYNEALICGEEPEMCIRLRQRGWKIVRIDVDMTYHDAAMLKFSQWWKRSMRGGWAVAEGAAMHGEPPERYMIRDSLSGWLWGLFLPVMALSLAWVTSGLSLLLFLGYPVLMGRVYQYRCSYGDFPSHAGLYAFFCVLYKFPQVIGQMKYWLIRWRGQQATLIEYKTSV